MKVSLKYFARVSAVTLLATIPLQEASSQSTVSFQQNVGGYNGVLDVIIGEQSGAVYNNGDTNLLGSSVEIQFLDGSYTALSDTVVDEKQLLIRFDDIIGAGAGQIPTGARITDAKLVLTTGSGGNAQSGGPFGVAQMLTNFDTSTTWNSINGLGNGAGGGAAFSNGLTARPVDKGYRGFMSQSEKTAIAQVADVTSIVQNWADGAANQGFSVTAGTADGWQIVTTGVTNPLYGPKLEVTYDVSPQPTKSTVSLQQGVNSYGGTTMSLINENGTVEDGALLDEAFLDGAPIIGGGGDEEIQALIKFDNIFAASGGPVPSTATILDAQLVITTGRPAFSTNSGTNGNFAAHQMLADWNLSTDFATFGSDGPSEDDGEIGPALDLTGSLLADALATFDVTDAVKAWQSGAPNYGLNLQSFDTIDGWAITWTGAFDPQDAPELIITYTEDVIAVEDADFNEDSGVDGEDFLIWQRGFGSGSTLAEGDANGDGVVNASDLTIWKDQYGSGSLSAATGAVPEPTSLGLSLVAAAALATGGRKSRI